MFRKGQHKLMGRKLADRKLAGRKLTGRKLTGRKLAGILVPLLFPATLVCAQVTSPTADYIDSVSYPVQEGKDPLFVFYQTNKVEKLGSLTATLPGSASYNFEWSRYNPSVSDFDPPFASETNVTSSSVNNLQEGGYRVRIFNGTTTDTSMTAWIMQDHMTAGVLKDANNEILPAFSTCNSVSYTHLTLPTN